jgi:hypothetical protein
METFGAAPWPVGFPESDFGRTLPSLQASHRFDLMGQVLQGVPIDSVKGGKKIRAADVARTVGPLSKVDPAGNSSRGNSPLALAVIAVFLAWAAVR